MTTITTESLEKVRQGLVGAGPDFAPQLNGALASLFPGIVFEPAAVCDSAGKVVDVDCVAHVVGAQKNDGKLSADDAPFAAHVLNNLTLENLRLAYGQMREVKRLLKTPVTTKSVETLTAVIAIDSGASLEAIGHELQALNATAPDNEWLDAVVVLSQGIASYKMRFLGGEKVVGFLPPSRSRQTISPILVYLAIASDGAAALKQFTFLLAGQLRFFLPKTQLPDVRPLVSSENTALLLATYQYDLSNVLREISTFPEAMAPFKITAADGSHLLSVWFQPWQTGGVVVAQGDLPLLGVLAMSGRKLPLETFPSSNGLQLSSVLPIGVHEFNKIMSGFAQRTRGVTVKRHQPEYTIAKLLDEGTTTPFVARLTMTPLTVRDIALTDKQDVKRFDDAFQPIQAGLLRIRSRARRVEKMWDEHAATVASGRVARVQNGAIHVDVAFDGDFNDEVDALVGELARTLKKFQQVTRALGVDIGFFFQKEARYQRELAKLQQVDQSLADYLAQSRAWAEPLRLFRDDLEHDTYVHPPVAYAKTNDGGVTATEPMVLDKPVRQYFRETVSRVNRFVEETMMWCFQSRLAAPLILIEIPKGDRDPQKLERFRVGLSGAGDPAWSISYSHADFDDV